MRKMIVAGALLIGSVAARAETMPAFDIAKLCAWQFENNSMNVEECRALEEDGKAFVVENEAKSTAERREACMREVVSYAGDSGFASYTVYAACLKDGPGGL